MILGRGCFGGTDILASMDNHADVFRPWSSYLFNMFSIEGLFGQMS